MEGVNFNIDFSLSGKVALVTGGAQGIGKAIALLFAQKGADLILVDMVEEVKEVAQEIEGYGRRALPLIFDLTDFDKIPQIVDQSVKALGKIDILVNNAVT